MALPWSAEDSEWAPESDGFSFSEAPGVDDEYGGWTNRSLGNETTRRWSRRGSTLINDPVVGLVLVGHKEVTGTKAYDLVCFPGKGHV